MMPLHSLLLLLALSQPVTNHVYVNSFSEDVHSQTSSLTTHSQKQSLVSYRPKNRTDLLVNKLDYLLAGHGALEIVRPSLDSFYGKSVIKSSTDPNEQTKSRKTWDALSAKSSHTELSKSRPRFLVSPKRVKREPKHSSDTAEPTSFSTALPLISQSPGVSFSHGTETKVETESMTDEIKDNDWPTAGSGDVLLPAEIGFMGSLTEAPTSAGEEHPQYRLQVQTAYSPSLQTSTSAAPTTNEKPVSRSYLQDASNRMSPSVANETQFGIGRLNTTTSPVIQPKILTTLPSPVSTNTINLQLKTPSPGADTISSNYLQPKTRTESVTLAPIPTNQPKNTRTKGTVNSTTDKPRASTALTALSGESDRLNTEGMTSFLRTISPHPIGRGRNIFFEDDKRYTEKDSTVLRAKVPSAKPKPASPTPVMPQDPCVAGLDPCVFNKDQNDPNTFAATNGSFLVWADLRRTLSFAWELHVFGSAALFLLLAAGSALGLALAPSMDCPHRGALVLANSLLLLAGAIRAGHFLLDPYGTRLLLPSPVIIASYTLPLPLLILAQAALVILVLKETEVTLIPPALQRPPLLGVLAVLQCTLLLAADLLSPALSPAVPIVLQSLTLTAGLALCIGYIILALPRLSHTHAARAGNKGMGEGKVQVVARVLAVCSLLGALCCLLHVYACLWLYGILGDWRRFRWAWWLCQFWARLLELAWAFCLLLVSSWVFWRPSGGQICGAPRQEGADAGNLPSPSPSSNSTSRHTCWAKIVQSLKVRQQRKSDSNGIGASSSSGVAGELPNNWPGQERSGADISKSLIRNRDPPKDSNHGRNLRSFTGGSAGSLLRLQALSQPHQRSLSSSLDRDKESTISLYDFDLRPPSPIDLTRSIDEALHREHLLRGESLFQPLRPPSPPPSPEMWMRRNSDPQITLSMSSDEHTLLTESSEGLDRSIPSAVPSRQVTAPPTPTHQGFRWASEVPVPSSLSCPVSLHPSPSTSRALTLSADNTRPFLTPELEGSQPNSKGGHLKVTRQDDSVSVSSDIIDL